MRNKLFIIIVILLLSPWVFGKQASAPLDAIYIFPGSIESKSNSSVSGLKIVREYYSPLDSFYLFKDTSIQPRYGYYGYFPKLIGATDNAGNFTIRDSLDGYQNYAYVQILIVNGNDTSRGPILFVDSSKKNEILGSRADCYGPGTPTHETFTFDSIKYTIQ